MQTKLQVPTRPLAVVAHISTVVLPLYPRSTNTTARLALDLEPEYFDVL